MAVQVYINFNGNCREAVDYYSKVFETEQPKFLLFGDAPADDSFPLTDEAKKLVMHTELNIEDGRIMFSDVPPGMPFTQGNNITLTVVTNDTEKIRKAFERLKEGGNVMMDLQETFFSKLYGFVIDKYGIGWQLSYEE